MNTLISKPSHVNFPAPFEDFFGRRANNFPTKNPFQLRSVPAVNVLEQKDGFRIEVAAPGFKKQDFKITLQQNNLIISAYHNQGSESNRMQDQYTHREYNYSSFQRTFTLPLSVDSEHIQASYTDGVLKIDIPKQEAVKIKSPRQIAIESD